MTQQTWQGSSASVRLLLFLAVFEFVEIIDGLAWKLFSSSGWTAKEYTFPISSRNPPFLCFSKSMVASVFLGPVLHLGSIENNIP